MIQKKYKMKKLLLSLPLLLSVFIAQAKEIKVINGFMENPLKVDLGNGTSVARVVQLSASGRVRFSDLAASITGCPL